MPISIKKSLFLAAALLLSSFLFSQNDAPKPPRFGGFENEVAVFPLSIQQFTEDNGGYTSGMSLVFKHQVTPFRGRKWKRSIAMRFCGGYFQEKHGYESNGIFGGPIGSVPPNPNPFERHQISQSKEFNRIAQIGFELRWQKVRFAHWLGADFGYRWGSSKSILTEILIDETVISLSETNEAFYAPGAAAFWGCRYFLLKRLSLGIEVGLPIEYEFSNSVSTFSGFDPTSSTNQFWEYPFSRPRFLCLAFHF